MTARNDALDKLAHLRRRAYRPVLEAGGGLETDSKLGGVAYLTKGAPQPKCSGCRSPQQLLVQLNTAQLPEALRKEFGQGIVQLFACSSCADVSFARLALLTGEPTAAAVADDSGQVIRNWTVVDDYPAAGDRDAFSIDLDDDEEAAIADITVRDDKLSGWPAWLGDPRPARCPECDKTMRLVFQINRGETRGQLCACPAHKSELAIIWQGS